MIHLDTSLLIAVVSVTDAHHATARKLALASVPFATSAVAWTEFHSRPVPPLTIQALKGLLVGGIARFDEKTAVFAGKLFYLTVSKRRTRLDTMIAASAILSESELATANPDDFQAFVPHGLKIREI